MEWIINSERSIEVKNEIKSLVNDPSFVYHKWYVEYHLDIVEQISLDLCDQYRNADKDLVNVMTWMHDFWKIIQSTNHHDAFKVKAIIAQVWFRWGVYQ